MDKKDNLTLETRLCEHKIATTNKGSPRFVITDVKTSKTIVREEMNYGNEEFSDSSFGSAGMHESFYGESKIAAFFFFRLLLHTVYCIGNIVIPVICMSNEKFTDNFYIKILCLFYLVSTILSSTASISVCYIEIKTRHIEPWKKTKGRILLLCALLINCCVSGLTLGLIITYPAPYYGSISALCIFIISNSILFVWLLRYCVIDTNEELESLIFNA